MPKNATRKLIDKQGNIYCIEIPHDVNSDSIDDIMVGMHDGIVKLHAYRLSGDVYRMPDNVECTSEGKEYSFYKKLNVFEENPELNQDDFGEALQSLLDRARNYRINRAEIKSYEGRPVLKDSRGYYLQREYPCVAEHCANVIKGEQRLSMRDGVISRAQAFEPFDSAATRVRQGSKSWFCPSCSPRSVGVPSAAVEVAEEPAPEVAAEAPNLPSGAPIIKEKVVASPRPDDDLRELLKMTDWKSDVPLEFLKGFIHGVLKYRLSAK